MVFLIQENLFKEEHYTMLIDIMEKYGFSYYLVRITSDNDDIIDLKTNLPIKLETNNVFCFGSIKMARISKNYNWKPGSFLNDNHDYEIYSEGFGKENMLNGDSIIYHFSDKFEFTEPLFIRPTKDTKVFTGQVFNKYEWDDFVESSLYNSTRYSLNDSTVIQVSKPKIIQQEVRCWVVKGKIITTSYYKLGNMPYMIECFDDIILNFAQKMVDKYQPADSFVIDICLVDCKPKIVEINCINCSGFYKPNLFKLIDSLLIYDIKNMDIKFYWNGGFAGINHIMVVNDDEIRLGGVISDEEDARIMAIEILKNDYNIDYNMDDITFNWGGEL